VRFDRNSYSIPHAYRQRPLTLLASPTLVRVVAGTEELARHARSDDTGQVIEQEAHVAGLIAATRQANPSSARDRLARGPPAATRRPAPEGRATRGKRPPARCSTACGAISAPASSRSTRSATWPTTRTAPTSSSKS
jgi:hypothetical protein